MQMTAAELDCPECGEHIQLPTKARRLTRWASADYEVNIDSLPLREHMAREHGIPGLP
jgi:endogenous inhibitor of DNA gyrase (YacG/DUF329 family)